MKLPLILLLLSTGAAAQSKDTSSIFRIVSTEMSVGWQGCNVRSYIGDKPNDTSRIEIGEFGRLAAKLEKGKLIVYDSAKTITELFKAYKALDYIIKGRDEELSHIWPILYANTLSERNAAIKKYNSWSNKKRKQ